MGKESINDDFQSSVYLNSLEFCVIKDELIVRPKNYINLPSGFFYISKARIKIKKNKAKIKIDFNILKLVVFFLLFFLPTLFMSLLISRKLEHISYILAISATISALFNMALFFNAKQVILGTLKLKAWPSQK